MMLINLGNRLKIDYVSDIFVLIEMESATCEETVMESPETERYQTLRLILKQVVKPTRTVEEEKEQAANEVVQKLKDVKLLL